MVAVLLTACGAENSGSGSGTPELSISDAWTRPTTVRLPVGDQGTATPGTEATVTTAVYLTIENDGDAADQLLRVTTSIADAVEMHESSISNGVMQMRQAQAVEVPAGESVVFEPGGLHVMLIGVHASLEVGDRFDLELTFAQIGAMTVTVEVREL